jgi:hypothetical protein
MGRLREFRVRLVDRATALPKVMSLLAETHTIAIYRAATLALEVGASEFEVFAALRRSF